MIRIDFENMRKKIGTTLKRIKTVLENEDIQKNIDFILRGTNAIGAYVLFFLGFYTGTFQGNYTGGSYYIVFGLFLYVTSRK